LSLRVDDNSKLKRGFMKCEVSSTGIIT